MAASFGRETPVLWYGPRAPAHPGKRKERVYLLWPAWAYKVMAPQLRQQRFNRLQMAVLGILSASRMIPKELGSRLGVDAELVERVISELQSLEYLDLSLQVTSRGREDLETEREESTRLFPAWVFRDPWNETLWPFVAEQWQWAQTAISEQGYLQLVFGTTGSPWYQPTFMQLPPPDAVPKSPDAREILRTSAEQKRIRKYGNQLSWEEEDSENFNLGGVDLKRLCQIEEEAYPVFLTTFCYIPQDGLENGLDWQVCDFFGRGDDLKLKRRIVEVAKKYPPLAHQLDRVIGRTQLYLNQSIDDFLAREEQQRARAHLALAKIMTLDIRCHETLFTALTEMLEAWFEIKDLGERASQRRQKHVLITCRQVLETLFGNLSKQFSLRGIWRKVPSDSERQLRETLFWHTAISVGFADFPKAWLHVKQSNLKSVCDFDNTSKLQPLVVATLLCAGSNPQHPLHSAATSFPDLLEYIARVIEHGGSGAHIGETPVVLSYVQSSVKQTLCIVGSLLGLPIHPLEEIDING